MLLLMLLLLLLLLLVVVVVSVVVAQARSWRHQNSSTPLIYLSKMCTVPCLRGAPVTVAVAMPAQMLQSSMHDLAAKVSACHA